MYNKQNGDILNGTEATAGDILNEVNEACLTELYHKSSKCLELLFRLHFITLLWY